MDVPPSRVFAYLGLLQSSTSDSIQSTSAPHTSPQHHPRFHPPQHPHVTFPTTCPLPHSIHQTTSHRALSVLAPPPRRLSTHPPHCNFGRRIRYQRAQRTRQKSQIIKKSSKVLHICVGLSNSITRRRCGHSPACSLLPCPLQPSISSATSAFECLPT